MKKKSLAILLAMALVLCMSSVAFAADNTLQDYKIGKTIELTNAGTINPAETFTFTVGNGTVVNGSALAAPNLSNISISVAQGVLTGSSAAIDLSAFDKVGVYAYPVAEIAGNTAGMVYDAEAHKLVVTVVHGTDGLDKYMVLKNSDGEKVAGITNTFSAGNLTVTKALAGNLKDDNDKFSFTVKLTPVGNKVINTAPIGVAPGVLGAKETDGSYTITYTNVTKGDYTITNIPYDVTYAVVETDNGGYIESYQGENGTINAATQAATITNTRGTDIPTGITLENLPYILVLLGVGVGLIAFARRRRFSK